MATKKNALVIDNHTKKQPCKSEKEELTSGLIEILTTGSDLESALKQVCEAISGTLSVENEISVNISFDGQNYRNQNFAKSPVLIKRELQLADYKKGSITLYFSNQTPEQKLQDTELILNTAITLIIGIISKVQLAKLSLDFRERQKELRSINYTTEVLKRSSSLDEVLQDICSSLPEAMQFPEYTVVRIQYGEKTYLSP